MKSSFVARALASVALVASLAAASAGPAAAQFGINIHLGPQPPPRREHVGHPPRPGCFFRRGHYVPRGHHWVWAPGHWVCR